MLTFGVDSVINSSANHAYVQCKGSVDGYR